MQLGLPSGLPSNTNTEKVTQQTVKWKAWKEHLYAARTLFTSMS